MTDDCPFCRRAMEPDVKVRSHAQHARYWKMIELAYEAWPDTHERQFADKEECRKYLQMKAGWFEEASRMPAIGARPQVFMVMAEAMFRAAGNFAIATQQGGDIVVYKPKSISFRSMGHKAACEIFDKVSFVIRDEIGVSGDELLERQKEVA